MPYRFLEHTSDIIIEAKNRTFEAALEDLCNGMLTQMGCGHAREKECIVVAASAPTPEQLIVELLSDIIAECETLPFLPKRATVISFTENGSRFSATISLSGERHVPENIIKAVTYHGLRIEKNADGCTLEVLFDI